MFDNSSTGITQAEIELVEQKLGVRFPKDFIEYYIRYNGGFLKSLRDFTTFIAGLSEDSIDG